MRQKPREDVVMRFEHAKRWDLGEIERRNALKRKPKFDLKEACQGEGREVLQVLTRLAYGNGRNNLKACELILAYGFGKPDSSVNLNHSANLNPNDLVAEVERRRAALAAGRQPALPDVIDVTPTERPEDQEVS